MGVSRKLALALLCVLSVALIVAGCGGGTTTTAAQSSATTVGQDATATTGGVTTTGAATGDKVITIGATCPLTGSLSKEGNLFKQGYEFWQKTVNEGAGIKVGNETYKVKIIIYDDGSNPQTAAKLTEQLISQDKVDFLLSPYSSGLVQATSSIAEKYKVINIAPVANAEQLYKRGYKYLFGILPRASENLSSLVTMADAYKMDVKSVVVVTPDDLFPLAGAAGVKARATSLGWKVDYIKYPKTATDLSGVVSQIKSLNPDAVISSAFFEGDVLLVKQMKEQRVSPKLIGFMDAPNLPDFVNTLGADANGIFGTTWWAPNVGWKDPMFGSTSGFVDAFKKATNTDTVTMIAAEAVAGAEVLQLALEKAGTLQTEAVREALLALDVETFLMPINFGQVEGMDQINVSGFNLPVQVQDGTPVVVYPPQVKQAEPIFPFPGWK